MPASVHAKGIVMRKLRCSNEECEGKEGNPAFNLTAVVDEDGTLAENPQKIDGEYFTCCYCSSEGEWIDE